MPKEETNCVEHLRHAEYYDMVSTFDELYEKSSNNEEFIDLMGIILSRENIMLAYRELKANDGSMTPGTDGLKIIDIRKMKEEEVIARVRNIVKGGRDGYTPRCVRRKDIPKPNGDLRPLGIPCIWDRLIQQCIKQVLEPICEAKFSNNSFGFRPNRSVENAISSEYRMIQRQQLHFVVEFDIKGFFDNVNHSKLIKQLWAMNIRDKTLIYVIKRILKAPIKLENGEIIIPTKGTPQGGIISPLLANVVLNELDHWVESQWQSNPVINNYTARINDSGCPILSHAYRAMRNTNLKEMYIIRYADDFRILCKTKEEAEKVKIAVTRWLKERLKLDVSPEKTKIVDVRNRYTEFLGFKIKAYKKSNKYVLKSHICDKASKRIERNLKEQAKRVAKPREHKAVADEIKIYNSMVMGIQNYYSIATNISLDCGTLDYRIGKTLKDRLGTNPKSGRIKRQGRDLTLVEKERYGKSAQIRYEAKSKEPIYPLGYIKFRKPMSCGRDVCSYTPEGRKRIHDMLGCNTILMHEIMRIPTLTDSIELSDNRLSLFSAQEGKCAVSGVEFTRADKIICHHKHPKKWGGSDRYRNLILVTENVELLINTYKNEEVKTLLIKANITEKAQIEKLNKLRKQSHRKPIDAQTKEIISKGLAKETKTTFN